MSEEFGKALERMVKKINETRKVQSEMADAFARFQREILDETARQFGAWVDEQITPPSGWQGFTGIRGIFDEWDPNGTIWAHYEWPETFTPEEFNRLWDGFTERRKIDYVLSLIT